MTEAAHAPEGQLIEGRYRIVRKIADGGMATVYQALDERLERTVAIKVMHTQLAKGPHRDQFVERFHREAKSAAAIANAHIVQVYDTGEYEGLACLVMEYVHGVNLRHEMDTQGTFSVRETLRIIAETLDGLAAAHRAGVVHRDIKPENILLNDRGHVQITDFGLARAASQATLSSTGMLLGTAAYLAPEMIEHNQATAQGDLYSVGIMAWEMLAGEVPFTSDNPVTLVFKHVHEDVPALAGPCPGIDAAVSQFIAHLTARSVQARPENAQEALGELRGIMTGLGVEAWQYRLDPARVGNAAGAGSQSLGDGTAVSDTVHTPLGAAPVPVPPTPPSQSGSNANMAGATSTMANATNADSPSGNDLSATSTLPEGTSPTSTRVMPAIRQADNRNNRNSQYDGASTETIQPAAQATQATQTIGMMPARPMQGAQALNMQQDDQSPAANTNPNPATDPATHSSSRRKPLIIALVVALVLALSGGGVGWWYLRGPGSYWTMPRPSDVSCSDNTPCAITDAAWQPYESTLKVANIPYQISQSYSDTVAKGRVIATRPEHVGDHVNKRDGSQVTVVVSQGIKQATIPGDILDPSSANGKDPMAALKRAGFTNVTHDVARDEYSLNLPQNAASSISPNPGTTMAHNKAITIVLSKGPMPVSMPDVVGRSKDDAQAAFDDAKLKPQYSEKFSDTVASGDVISASVKAGTQLHWGDSVDVVISKGPEMVTIPDVRGQKTEDAKKTIEALGLRVKVSAPLGDITHTVRLQDPSPGQQVRVRDAKGTTTVVTLTMV
ncbi:Stk1 family PASTA domain-containing Ser/Thr kinase [Bifidobacterium tibiigranuli]|jgi:serine/threonine-protein kinase|uniref:Stk1 family PASTA domain-containing Ser/Thr kinase n=1 Tax=Bifidobacterium tibiigranuli TaxID=2172043 RepID=UPI0023558E2C|nr:Stk1 family PASTA domain-containing Ser/Thr kinase [Bifidobacterium tibiigranuli]MCI1211063.1 PASTA domain-containing protein [Bifidobacterium tibiigranuli]MCI1220427.1 PASTA domain-containing protein [Bifidobacterium tibiigranuli]MCI1231890.1 PASTA domain-containing protein [Bifidobacterium tibiigranuli]